MSKVVVISGHPNLKDSYTNTVVLSQLAERIEDIDVRYLDRLYPDYQIDIVAEQQALLDAETVVLQFPFYWYSVPALLKKWLDDVFAYDFAYGSKGDKLKGKNLLLSFTIGGPEESYDALGYNHFPIEELIKPLKQTAYLAGVNLLPAIYTHRMVFIPGVYNTQEEVELRATDHADKVVTAIEELHSSAEAKITRFVADWFEQFDQLKESPDYFLAALDENVHWEMPEGVFKGHAGFVDWYEIAKNTFEPDCQHNVEQVEVLTNGKGFKVNLRIRLIAELKESQETINMLVNEVWQVSLNDSGQVRISDYRVEVV